MLNKLLVVLLLTVSSTTFACEVLKECVELASKLTGKKYIHSLKLDEKVSGSKNVEWKIDTADSLLSKFLFMNEYARVDEGDGSFTIIKARDVRYYPIKSFLLGQDKLPDSYDYVMGTYTLKFPERIQQFTKGFRPFLSRYGRIIAHPNSGQIVIQDSSKNVKRFLQNLYRFDVKLTKKELSEIRKEEKHQRQIELLQAKAGLRK